VGSRPPRSRPHPSRLHGRPGSRPLGDESEQELRRPILVRRGQDLVAWVEAERPEDGVERGGGVEDEREVPGFGADVLAEHGADGRKLVAEPAFEQVDGLALELELPPLIGLEDGARTGAECTVIQVGDLRIEQEEIAPGHRPSLLARGRMSR
jgi:hypothetical protein